MGSQDERMELARVQGRQDMIIEWVGSLEDDIDDVKNELAEEGVMDYGDKVEQMENRIDQLSTLQSQNQIEYESVTSSRFAWIKDILSEVRRGGLRAWALITLHLLTLYVMINLAIRSGLVQDLKFLIPG